jgi:hypothetical protein
MNQYRRIRTNEIVRALQYTSGINDCDIKQLILSNMPDRADFDEEDQEGFVMLTMALIDAHPGDWIIVEPASTKALTPEAFERAYESLEVDV